MKIEVFKNRMVYKEGVAGTQKENNFEIIDFKFPEELLSYKKYIEFDTQDGKFVDEIKNDSYSIERNITKYPKVVVQVVMKDLQNDIVFKSQLFNLFFNDSINASEELEIENKGLLDTLELELLEIQSNVLNNTQDINTIKTRVQNIESEQITQNENIEDNTSARHTHSNKSVLDGISSQDIINWNNKAEASDIPDVSNFINNTVNNLVNYYLKDETYTKIEVNNLIGQIASLQFQVVNELPVTGDSKYIYLAPSSSPKTQNIKDEYIWVNNAWEQIGSTQVDLTGYATESWVNLQISNFLTQSQIQTLINTSLSEYVQDSNYVHTDNNYTTEEKTKLASLENYDDTQLIEYIEKIEKENEALYKDHPDITETGTSVTLNGTSDFKMKVDIGGNSIQGDLPNEYQQVEYIESTGTQYIDTGIKLNQDSKIITEIQLTNDGSQSASMFGSRTSSTENNFECVSSSSSSVGIRVDFQSYEINRLTTPFNNEKNYILISKTLMQIGERTKRQISYTNFETPSNCYIFYVSGENIYGQKARMKLYNFKIYQNDVLIRDFIPCYKKINNEIGLYDIVSKSFFINQGTETFIKGNDIPIEPTPSNPIEIKNVEGNITITAKNSDNSKTNSVTFPLLQGQKLMQGDTLKDDGVYHKRAKVTANELKTVTTYVNQLTDFVRISFMISDLTNKVANEIPSGLCNYLKFLYDYTNESNHFYARGNVIYVFLEKTLLSSLNVTGVRAFLDEHPDLEIEYDLAKETPEAYTTTQQTAYNQLKQMQSYYDLTYVVSQSDDAQPIITAYAKKSLKVMQNEIDNIESRLSLLE